MASQQPLQPHLHRQSFSQQPQFAQQHSTGISSPSPQNVSNNQMIDNINSYNHQATTVPPYVLDSVSKAHHKDLDNFNGNVSTISHHDSLNTDLFTSSLNNNWNNFLSTVKNTPAILKSNFNNNNNNQNQNLYNHNSINYNNHRPHSSLRYSNRYLPIIDESSNTINNNLTNSSSNTIYNTDSNLEENYKLADLSGDWQGDERLRKELNDDSLIGDSQSNSFLSHLLCLNLFSNSPNKSADKNINKYNLKRRRSSNSPKVRSSAKYWMASESRERWAPTIKRFCLNSPYLLVFLRTFMLILTLVALGLACSLFTSTQSQNHSQNSSQREISQQPSTIMAICVQSIASLYILYITWDEYSGQPIGLRNPMDKIKLISLDLLFIIFSSANLSLAFNTLYDSQWVCVATSQLQTTQKRSLTRNLIRDTINSLPLKIDEICDKQRALASFLFLILFMWVLTFSISIFRIVERVSSPKS
ncbi:phospholipase D regulator ASCRUDRAFT_77384 [Ascoidea rubescens DSM 1968]|uniref:Regulator of phospholipase D SRF1 n=1 Tax=Ascoidea rubescens DSM 1968 TaxID=1344418 RepID=A0A1D2VBG9_9ASCO|nr:hypothetical protein ASCRUDRAFT_77384 [Ascoidea rubescens DSM 1968]ODV58950.1 hypothetical protein ASCRUDRAFT_77384 [Ascoidea rubescens DSM 1968]